MKKWGVFLRPYFKLNNMIYTPPQNIASRNFKYPSVFLAGSIEMNNAEDWQAEAIKLIEGPGKIFNIFNPRRPDWNNDWETNFESPQFSQQVHWELNALEVSDHILMYFDPKTKSPISLLELGLYANSGKMIVVCPQGFWRKGNVDIICEEYEIPLFTDLKSAIDLLKFKYQS